MKKNSNPARSARHRDEMPSSPSVQNYVPWRERPFLPMKTAAEVLGCSRTQVYNLAHPKGDLRLVTLSGKTQVETDSLIAYLKQAQPLVLTGKNPRGAALVRARAKIKPDETPPASL